MDRQFYNNIDLSIKHKNGVREKCRSIDEFRKTLTHFFDIRFFDGKITIKTLEGNNQILKDSENPLLEFSHVDILNGHGVFHISNNKPIKVVLENYVKIVFVAKDNSILIKTMNEHGMFSPYAILLNKEIAKKNELLSSIHGNDIKIGSIVYSDFSKLIILKDYFKKAKSCTQAMTDAIKTYQIENPNKTVDSCYDFVKDASCSFVVVDILYKETVPTYKMILAKEYPYLKNTKNEPLEIFYYNSKNNTHTFTNLYCQVLCDLSDG